MITLKYKDKSRIIYYDRPLVLSRGDGFQFYPFFEPYCYVNFGDSCQISSKSSSVISDYNLTIVKRQTNRSDII